jgi:phosphoglycerate kinase
MKILRVDELNWDKIKEKERNVFLRVDFNVPIQNGKILDDFRIRQAIPTINYLLEKKCKIVLASHLGRPQKVNEEKRKSLTLLPIAEKLAEICDKEVMFSEEQYGDGVRKLLQDGKAGETLIVLENLRFVRGEEKNNLGFAEDLFENCHIYVNDAFGASHRAHASIDAITHKVKLRAMGFLLAKEWEALSKVLSSPLEPQMAVLGGAKISDKIKVFKNLLPKVSQIFVGGRMANTFLAAQGFKLGGSSIEEDALPTARRILSEANAAGVSIALPFDGIAAVDMKSSEAKGVDLTPGHNVPDDLAVFDIGPKTLAAWKEELLKAKSVIWNGPMGVCENPCFAEGTLGLVDFFVENADSISTIAGGGETVAAVSQRGALEKLHHVSTGGGAMLEFLEGKSLPGFEALQYKTREVEAMAAEAEGQ